MLNALSPGGHFYLSFFNANLKNRVKQDSKGSWLDGSITYERLNLGHVKKMIPDDIELPSAYAMNISYNPELDKLLARLPFARLFARMFVLTGRKRDL